MLPDGNVRASGYGVTGTPFVIFDGQDVHSGGIASGSMFYAYEPAVVSRLAAASPLVIDATYVVLDGQVTVTTNIDVDTATSGSNRLVQFFVTQENEHGHLNMVMAMLPPEPFSLTTPGQTVSIERSFPMDADWTEPELNVVVMVQDSATKVVHQSGQAIPDYAGQVVVDCDPDGVEAAWTLTGPGLTQSGQGDAVINVFAAGTYTLEWEDVPFWDLPASPQQQTLVEEGTITFTGAYTNGPFTAVATGPLGDVGAGSAISLVDIDNDGDLDVHMTSGTAGDKLLLNDGPALFSEVAGSPLAAASDVRGAAWADMNGDGNTDVYLTRNGQTNQLYLGDGAGGFTLATTFGNDFVGPGSSAAWVDYDRDGLLDVSVTNQGSANLLLRSQGEIAPGLVLFSAISGLIAHTGNGSCVIWGDGDLNGRLDPFLVNRFSANVLLENTPIGFSDLTAGQGMGNLGNSKGAAWGDFDNDGDFDLYLANDGQADVLYQCTGPFQYNQVAGTYLADKGHGRGVVWADLDNDGNLDLYVARFDEPDLALLGDGMGGFQRLPVGPDEATYKSNAVASGDMDGDGRLDIVVSREGAANVMFRNQLGAGNHWVRLHLDGSGTNTDAIGARVIVTAGGVSRTRLVNPGSSYLACSAADPHFGLGTATQIDQIDIHWPSGLHQIVGPQLVDRVIGITEGVDPASAVGDEGDLPRSTSLHDAYPNPFNPSTTISFALDRAGHAKLTVYTVDGRPVRTLADADFGPGTHRVAWDGTDRSGRQMASGTYLYRLTADGGFDASGRMVLIK